ncbi:hypothetical protein SAMN05192580_1356 [Sphingomonas jatrophae]|uniref:Uncharacterized protein n=1 Tax=Sphingomonas jatrophae TaxID=1166337 RepID=A0A1I6K5S8_9SPHN|nr:hypothetical protein SAMN05192580_1356 [Sphingomonas jatrophae]
MDLQVDTCPHSGCVRFSAVPEPDPASTVAWAERVLLSDYQQARGYIMVAPEALRRLIAVARTGL